jgi:hypothetical protein
MNMIKKGQKLDKAKENEIHNIFGSVAKNLF